MLRYLGLGYGSPRSPPAIHLGNAIVIISYMLSERGRYRISSPNASSIGSSVVSSWFSGFTCMYSSQQYDRRYSEGFRATAMMDAVGMKWHNIHTPSCHEASALVTPRYFLLLSLFEFFTCSFITGLRSSYLLRKINPGFVCCLMSSGQWLPLVSSRLDI